MVDSVDAYVYGGHCDLLMSFSFWFFFKEIVMETSVVDAGAVSLVGRTRGSKYDGLVEQACATAPGKMLLINIPEGDTAVAVTRRLRNYLGKHNKKVKADGTGVKLGIRPVKGGKQIAIIKKGAPSD